MTRERVNPANIPLQAFGGLSPMPAADVAAHAPAAGGPAPAPAEQPAPGWQALDNLSGTTKRMVVGTAALGMLALVLALLLPRVDTYLFGGCPDGEVRPPAFQDPPAPLPSRHTSSTSRGPKVLDPVRLRAHLFFGRGEDIFSVWFCVQLGVLQEMSEPFFIRQYMSHIYIPPPHSGVYLMFRIQEPAVIAPS